MFLVRKCKKALPGIDEFNYKFNFVLQAEKHNH